MLGGRSLGKVAFVTGITGQDGIYLADFLIKKGYEVHGLRRYTAGDNLHKLRKLINDHENSPALTLHYGDLTDTSSLSHLIKQIEPDEIYNLAAQSHVGVSFDLPEYTANVNAMGTLRLLEAIRLLNLKDKTRFYQASTSELFGNKLEGGQHEKTPFHPMSPYAISKLYAYWITINYREAYGIFACNGLLFNHESPLRGENFVTRKITRGLCRIHLGLQETLYLGNLDASRDWGHARDYVEMQWLMLQQANPDDYVIATGRQATVREFIQIAASVLGLHLIWKGMGVDEKAFDEQGHCIVAIDPKNFRPSDVDSLLGDSSKARAALAWSPKTTLEEMILEMINNDYNEAKREKLRVSERV